MSETKESIAEVQGTRITLPKEFVDRMVLENQQHKVSQSFWIGAFFATIVFSILTVCFKLFL